MYIVGQEGWASIAETLAAQGYRVLTFDYRGYGPSAGERDTTSAPIDVAAAVAFMKEYEFQPVVLLGAGIGGSAAIKVAAQDGDIVGLAILSAPRAFQGLEVSDADLATLSMPTLWIAARNDMTQNVEEMQALAPTTDSTLWIYEGSSLQGTFIFEGADGPDLQQRLLEFVARVAGTP
jgi:pimeloyl-ACP methyl ester carboxylesterase